MEPIADTNHQDRLQMKEAMIKNSTIDPISEEDKPFVKCLCKIEIPGRGYGSGFLCKFQCGSEEYTMGMFTAHHVLDEKKNYFMIIENKRYEVTDDQVVKVWTSPYLDATFVIFNIGFVDELDRNGWQFFEVYNDDIVKDSSVTILQYPVFSGKVHTASTLRGSIGSSSLSSSTIESNVKNEWNPVFNLSVTSLQQPPQAYVSRGKVTRCSKYILTYSASTLSGSSGSPLLDDNYKVFGIHNSGNYFPYDEVNGDYNIGTPIKCAIDFIRNSSESGGNLAHAGWMQLRVGALSLKQPIYVPPEITVRNTLDLLAKESFDQIPVVNKNQIIGMVTVGQLMSGLVEGKIRSSDPVFNDMDTKFIKVNLDTTLAHLSRLLYLDHFVVVVNIERQIGKELAETNKENIHGIVTRFDLAHFLAQF